MWYQSTILKPTHSFKSILNTDHYSTTVVEFNKIELCSQAYINITLYNTLTTSPTADKDFHLQGEHWEMVKLII